MKKVTESDNWVSSKLWLENTFSYTCILPVEVLTELLKLNIHKSSGLGGIRDRPFSLKGGGVMVFCFVQKFFFGQHKSYNIYCFCREIFFQNITSGYMTKTLNQIIFFPPPKSEYFFQQH